VIALDTNILVYAHRSATSEHDRARQAIEEAAGSPGGFGFALPTICEFWSVVTHPAASGRPSTPSEAADFVRSLVEDGGARIWTARPGLAERMLDFAIEQDIRGPRVFDLQIAVLALESGATEFWTHDRGFARVPGLKMVDPLG
jgi:toxin-antitoxin system PIN domain toxin